ncbi:HVA22-like protein k [Andrographis paniculata]|uniref:HVA22-like protein k n=1 Tax=Andrographis paniculata TaxID=175694 RepID=UPI0021E76179|nr:HVA22-like protein k [Andrographis paniculata]XP_051146713.1 HVA22-like protein k [Andrographis paniculata]
MALFGSGMSTEVGLRLLLNPLSSNIVVRTACCSVGVVLPVYSTFKAIETKDEDEQNKWLMYWTVYGSFSLAEIFTDKLIYWCPFYYHMKFAFLVWLQLPTVYGARQLYMNYLRPFLLKHQSRLDQIVNFCYGEMARFVSSYESEIQVARAILTKIMLTANHAAREILHPGQRPANGSAIQGGQDPPNGTATQSPPAQDETSESGDED